MGRGTTFCGVGGDQVLMERKGNMSAENRHRERKYKEALNRCKRQLRDARDSIRQGYRNAVREVEGDFWATYEEFSKDFYEGELNAIDELRDDLVGPRRARTEMVDSL